MPIPENKTAGGFAGCGLSVDGLVGNAFDAGDNNYTSATIARQVIKQSREDEITVILMHDWNLQTLGALDTIISTLREENYLFLPLFKESVMNGNCIPRWG